MVVDHYTEKWREYPYTPQIQPLWPAPLGTGVGETITITTPPQITPEELAEFRKLLDRAREYDKRNNEPNCELEEKKATLRKLVEQLGVEIDFL